MRLKLEKKEAEINWLKYWTRLWKILLHAPLFSNLNLVTKSLITGWSMRVIQELESCIAGSITLRIYGAFPFVLLVVSKMYLPIRAVQCKTCDVNLNVQKKKKSKSTRMRHRNYLITIISEKKNPNHQTT